MMLRDAPKAVHLKDYRPPAFLIDSIDLEFVLDDDATAVRSRIAVRRNPDAAAREQDLVLHGEELELVSLQRDGKPLTAADYRLTPHELHIRNVPDRFGLVIDTRIYPHRNTSLEGLYVSNDMFCTQCEAEGFRKITYYLDRSDVMARFSTRIEADRARYPVLLSNGNLVARGDAGGGRHWARWEDPFPKPSYLFALVAGTLDVREDEYLRGSGRKVALRLYVRPGDLDKTRHAMDSLKRAMAWDEETWGLEYDLDVYMIVAVGDFNMGAMENKGLNIFNTAYVLANPETATDTDFENVQGVIGHEYFHNWSGNRVTCRDWFQLSLKEGLTVFRDQEFSAESGSRAVKRIDDVRMLRARQFPEDAGPMAHPVRPQSYVEINNFYTATVYEKGAEVVRMIQTLVGRRGFRKGMDLYFRRHDGQAVTTNDFVAAMADANGVDLTQFQHWYEQAGTPVVSVHGDYDDRQQKYTLTIAQHTPATPGQTTRHPLHIPFVMGLLDSAGHDLPLQLADGRRIAPGEPLQLTQASQRFEFVGIAERPVPSLLRGFSAPVQLQADLSDDELAFLFARDTDRFNRWESGQRLAIRILQKMTTTLQQGGQPDVDRLYIDAVDTMLAQPDPDRALVAEAMVLPGEVYLSELAVVADPDAIHGAREAMRHILAHALSDRMLSAYHACHSDGAYEFNAQAAGRRRLKNQMLAYLVTTGDPDMRALAMRQFRGADNMTDRLGALGALIDTACAEREEALADFQEQGKGDPLVLDKWFAAQAASALPDTLERVEALLGHPAFSLRNPNKVRALIGSFAHRNLVRFHEMNGAGYRFVADRVLELDPLNPQVAARLAGAFNRWRKYDDNRQRLMRAELERILAATGLSRAVYEIASKALEV